MKVCDILSNYFVIFRILESFSYFCFEEYFFDFYLVR